MPLELHFLRPYWFLALVPLLLILIGLWVGLWRARRAGTAWQGLVDAHLLPHLLVGEPGRPRRLPLVLLALAWLMGVVALAGPVRERLPQPVFSTTAKRVILLDLSPSMNAADVAPSRLARARFEVLDLLAASREGQVALIAFGGAGVWLQLEGARGRHPDEAVEGVRTVLRVLVLFFLVTPFWSLFDQKASTWILQADAMTKPSWFQSSQMQALNPLLVMLLIPFNNLVLYPALKRLGCELTALRRITLGIAFSGLSWIVVGGMQVVLDGGHAFSIAWQVLPYALLTLGEVLVSTTGLEFAYSQAPLSMKGALMSFWNLSVTIGNLWVLIVNASVKNSTITDFIRSTGFGVTAFQMFFFAGFAFVAALAFGLYALRYRVVDHYRKA
jgi:hypothetical protein